MARVRMHECWLPVVLLAAMLAGCSGAGAQGLPAAQAAQHVGDKTTICGVVASAHYAADVEGQPTFVNLDKTYPNSIFTIVIWGDYRGRFATPPETWHGHLCATGVIRAFHGKPEIKVVNPSQISH